MPQVKINAMLQARMIAMLVDSPASIHDICQETGLHYVTVQRYVRELRKVNLLGVCAWEKDSRGRDAIPVFEWGRKRDKPRFKMTQAERQAAFRARKAARELTHMTAGRSLS